MPLIRKPIENASAKDKDAAAILEALTSPVADERWKAARAAADIPDSAPILGQAISVEADARVREAMFTSLSRNSSPESLDALLMLLRSDSANVRMGALDALQAVGPQLHEKLPALLQDKDTDVRILSCELLRNVPGEAATSLLCGLLTVEENPNVCAAAIDVLAEVGGPEALSVLAACEKRFRETPFLVFAVKAAAERIGSHSARPRV